MERWDGDRNGWFDQQKTGLKTSKAGWNIFYFSIYWEKYSQLTNIFQTGRSTTNQKTCRKLANDLSDLIRKCGFDIDLTLVIVAVAPPSVGYFARENVWSFRTQNRD
jgi:hypothetical protein